MRRNMRLLRKAHHLTIEKVAKELKVSPQLIQKYETGEVKNPCMFQLEKMAKLYEATVPQLLDEEEIDIFESSEEGWQKIKLIASKSAIRILKELENESLLRIMKID